jgi:hypothetical protein
MFAWCVQVSEWVRLSRLRGVKITRMNTALLRAHPQVNTPRPAARPAPAVTRVAVRPVPAISAQDKAVFGAFANTDRFSLAAFKQAYSH